MSLQELDLRPRVYYIEGGDDVRSSQYGEFMANGLNVGLIAMSLAQVVQQIEAGWVREFNPQVAVVSQAFVDGPGSQVQHLFQKSGLQIPSIAYTTTPVFWHNTFGFCLAPNVEPLRKKIDKLMNRTLPSPVSPRAAR